MDDAKYKEMERKLNLEKKRYAKRVAVILSNFITKESDKQGWRLGLYIASDVRLHISVEHMLLNYKED